MESNGRRHPVHLPSIERFNTPVVIFLTVCTKSRKPILASDPVHQLLRESWQVNSSWIVGRYIVMPDHVHLFCAPSETTVMPITPWVKLWKSYTARSWPNADDAPVWQRDFWDRQLRYGESYAEKWDYVVHNAVRANLVERPEQWPYQGELNVFRW
jgi:putative transposase